MIGLERPDYLWALLLLVPLLALAWWTRRRLTPGRRVISAAARSLLLVLMVLAVAGLTWREEVDALGVAFVLDRSASVGAGGQQVAEEFVTRALEAQDDEDRAGVVVFGAEALLEMEPRADAELHGIESAPSPHQSDLAAGLRLGSAVLPADRARRVVLLSDGEQTRGDAATQALLTAGDELEIAVVPLASVQGADVILEDLLVPPHVDEGAAYEVRVVARAEAPVDGTLRLYRNDEYLGEVPVELTGGRADVFTFRQEASQPGLFRYRAALEVDDDAQDSLPQNNEGVATVQVSGRPRVLYAEGYPDQSRHLARVLEEEGFVVDVVRPEQIPPGPADLRPYAAVVLSDVPAYALSQRQMRSLRAYVRDLGRGLVMIGGDRSFGLGGYYRTPVEEALPVRMDIQDKTPFPKLGMVIALDKSGSMSSERKLDMAKEAGIQTVELLSARDMLGVIGFDHAASWIVPLGDLSDKKAVTSTIASIRTGGGTDIYPALKRGIDSLNSTDASLKHVILLSDGITSAGAFEPLLRGARHEDVTLTAIALGSDADRHTMQQFAEWGGGNYYLVTDSTAIPAIFTRETLLATQAFLLEEPFQPVGASPSDLLRGLPATELPQLGGLVATEAKQRSTVALTDASQPALPVLVHWHYGLGRSVAFTSDCKPRWAKQWLGTEAYDRFWTQTIRWVAGDPTAGALQVDAEIHEGELVVTVDAFSPDGAYANFLEGEARVVTPDLSVRPLDLRQTAPGRYAASVPVDQDGSWLVGVSMTEGGEVVGQAVAEAVQPYSPEYRSRGAGPALLAELGRLGGGGTLTDPAEAFGRPARARAVPHPLWPLLLALSALLLLVDVALRRLALSARIPVGATVESLATALRRPPRTRRRPRPRPAAPVEEVEPEDPPEPELPEVEPDSYAGRLLAARDAARRKLEGDE